MRKPTRPAVVLLLVAVVGLTHWTSPVFAAKSPCNFEKVQSDLSLKGKLFLANRDEDLVYCNTKEFNGFDLKCPTKCCVLMQKELMKAAVVRGVRQDVSAKDWKFDVDLRARFGEATECTQSAFETEYAEDLSAACSFSNVGTAFVMKFKTNAAQAGALCSSELQLLRDRCTPACCEKLRDLYSAEAQQNVAEGRTGRKMQLSSDLGKSKLSQEPSCTVGAYKRELAKPASSWNAEGPTIQTSGAVFKAALSREISAFGTAVDKIDISRYVSSKPHSLWDAVLAPSERSSLKSSLRASLHFRVVAEAEVDSLLKRGYASAACLDDATVFASGTCLHTLEGLWEKNDIASPEKLLTVHKDRYRVSVIKSLSFAPHYCPSSQQKILVLADRHKRFYKPKESDYESESYAVGGILLHEVLDILNREDFITQYLKGDASKCESGGGVTAPVAEGVKGSLNPK